MFHNDIICILMGTYNGEKFLQEQLDSFYAQTYQNWILYISDDGSTDKTLEILNQFQQKMGPDRVVIVNGPKQGFAANFLSLLCLDNIQADYYAFSDQDDIWMPEKLARAYEAIKNISMPALYGARTLLTNEADDCIGYSTKWKRKPSFQNALVQSIAGGNTMLLNKAARDLVKKYSEQVEIVSHDWWIYQLVTGCGGVVIYDAVPTLRYRQHGKNLVGQSNTLRGQVTRFYALLQGRFQGWNKKNVCALSVVYEEFTAENQRIFNHFAQARSKNFLLTRALLFAKSGVHRQTLLGNAGILAAMMLNKI